MLKKISAIALAAVMMAGTASAATVTFVSEELNPQVRLELTDTAAGLSAGSVRFSIDSAIGFADYLGLGFDYAGTMLKQTAFSLVSFTSLSGKPNTPAIVLYGNNTGTQSTCGQGCNLNGAGGTGNTQFDYIVRIGEQGGGKNNVSSVEFDIAGTSLTDFSNFAVRAQETSNGDSIKYGLNPVMEVTPPAPVPLPAAGFGLFAGIGALAALRRRKRAAAA